MFKSIFKPLFYFLSKYEEYLANNQTGGKARDGRMETNWMNGWLDFG